MALDIIKVESGGDKRNTDFFIEFRPKICERRRSSGIDDRLGNLRGTVFQVEADDTTQPYKRMMVDRRMSRFQATELLEPCDRALS